MKGDIEVLAPLAPKPIAILELVQLKTAPAVFVLNTIGVVNTPLHTVILEGTSTSGLGFIFIK